VENVAKKKRKRNTTVKNAKPKRRKRRSNAHLKKKSVENVLLYKLPSITIFTCVIFVSQSIFLTAFVVTNHYFLEKTNDL
jgi:hypothetical protein